MPGGRGNPIAVALLGQRNNRGRGRTRFRGLLHLTPSLGNFFTQGGPRAGAEEVGHDCEEFQ